VVARELEVLGSHGMAVGDYGEVFDLIAGLDLSKLISRRLTLDELPAALESMRAFSGAGISVVTDFD
ncbi:MAG: alcohol dehydrogenase, partial [Acidimicrobiia bacterium]